MPTWTEAAAHLRTRYTIARDEPTWIGMMWSFRAGDVEMEEPVRVELISAYDEDWLLVQAVVCKADRIEAAGALRWNSLVAIGGLALDGPYCVLRSALPLDTMAWRDLDRTISFIARETPEGRPRTDVARWRGCAGATSGPAEGRLTWS